MADFWVIWGLASTITPVRSQVRVLYRPFISLFISITYASSLQKPLNKRQLISDSFGPCSREVKHREGAPFYQTIQ